jgi:hypothetical protein
MPSDPNWTYVDSYEEAAKIEGDCTCGGHLYRVEEQGIVMPLGELGELHPFWLVCKQCERRSLRYILRIRFDPPPEIIIDSRGDTA